MASSLVEASGHKIAEMFLNQPAEKFEPFANDRR